MIGDATAILMYHSIATRSAARFTPFCVAPALFDAQMAMLREEGYESLTVSDLVSLRQGGKTPRQKSVVITFDDGFADFHHTALPILAEYSHAATLYVATGCIGATSSWLSSIGEGARPMMTWGQVAACAANNVEIGAHSVTHRPLDLLAEADVIDEVSKSRRDLEAAIGKPVESFAYPFGYTNARVGKIVEAAGFKSACGVRYRYSPPTDNTFELSRMIVRNSCSPAELLQIVRGNPQVLPLARDRVRSAARRTYRYLAGAIGL